jgi:MarR family transcriptional regulator, repressor for mepA
LLTMADEEPRPSSALGLLRWIGWAQMKAADEWVRARDLTREQSFALGFLAQNPGSIQRDIAQLTRTSAASVSSLLQGLERRGLVERRTEQGDERSKRVYATAAGAALIAGWDDAMADVEESILAPLDADERAQLLALLTKVTSVLPTPTRT